MSNDQEIGNGTIAIRNSLTLPSVFLMLVLCVGTLSSPEAKEMQFSMTLKDFIDKENITTVFVALPKKLMKIQSAELEKPIGKIQIRVVDDGDKKGGHTYARWLTKSGPLLAVVRGQELFIFNICRWFPIVCRLTKQ